jgi:SnoaL-like domain
MTGIEKLLAIEDIRRLKAAYFRCMDTKNWDELPTLFTDDASFDVRGALEMPKPDYSGEPVVSGRAAITAYIRDGLTPLISVHHGHSPEIEITSATSAKGIWPMTDMLVAPEGAPFHIFRGYGYYRENYRRQDDIWRIASLELRRLFVETV